MSLASPLKTRLQSVYQKRYKTSRTFDLGKSTVARKVPQLAPPELETARACVKSTHYAWFWRALLIWASSSSPDKKRDFSLIPKSNIFVFRIRENIFN